ncbi:BnaA05g36540D [Brassica napus]|uniref:BnaA05g36540D protein n=1 Tax=Brassica napus TaxID=3708 RepID=A0A078JCX6_BRANA|nr:BnaA05g36540D [Brassica napus]
MVLSFILTLVVANFLST